MKYPFKAFTVNVAVALILALPSCKKQDLSATVNTASSAAIQAAALQLQAIAVAASTSTTNSTSTTSDSIYVLNTCPAHGYRNSVAFSSLAASITNYLSTNYSGYTFLKAFSIFDASGVLQGYGVIIQFNGNPIGLKFDSNGNFLQILEQREGHDLLGNGWHDGGCFQDRDGRQRDTLAFSALPASILTYFSTNYPTDTLIRAAKTRSGGYVILSKDNGLFATTFDANGNFVNRMQLPAHDGRGNPIDQSALPSNVLSYLTATYPGYVFNKAFSITINGVIQGYCVVIDANNTKYAIQFDASGNYVRTKVIH